MYTWNLLSLWFSRKINFRTVRYALKNRPIAVAGSLGSYIVDPEFE
ncbi:hypothetical protein [Acidovorax carolinensis]|jgi:hypothetical protein|nr:hypothetical protein [Acidovorax carolinensis]